MVILSDKIFRIVNLRIDTKITDSIANCLLFLFEDYSMRWSHAELDADAHASMAKVLWNASGVGFAGRDLAAEVPPMEGTGFLTMMREVPARPWTGPEGPWLGSSDLQIYADEFAHSGFFGPISYYRNLDANFDVTNGLGPERVAMPTYFIGGTDDVVNVMDPSGIERMTNLLPDFRGSTVLDGVGHWTQQEAPAAFNDALLGFLHTL